ncbi:MAG: YqhA family protein [Pelagimonas sp.]|jgi:uncharacterized membrane protein YqhA|nr:YqhA family protein [Pelagimonas sp.]
MIRSVLGLSRYLILIAVLGALLAATALLVYGFAEAVSVVKYAIQSGEVSRKGAKAMAIEFIEIIDLFLMATVFYIIALGLYELFIDSDVQLPKWLEIRTLDDLKSKLIAVVVVVLAVLFLGQAVTWDGQTDLMGLGIGIAAVIAALTWFLGVKVAKAPKGGDKG